MEIDVGINLKGWISDNAVTVPVGKINGEQKRLLAVTEESLFVAIINPAINQTALSMLCEGK